MPRIRFVVSDENASQLKELQRRSGLQSRNALFRHAIAFTEWYIEQVRNGRIVCSIDYKKNKMLEVQTPTMKICQKKKRKK